MLGPADATDELTAIALSISDNATFTLPRQPAGSRMHILTTTQDVMIHNMAYQGTVFGPPMLEIYNAEAAVAVNLHGFL